MIWILLAAFSVLGLFIWLGLDLDNGRFVVRQRQLLALFGLVFILIGSFKIIPANSVGIIFNPFTGVQEQVLTEGFKTKTPLDTIYVISTEVQTKTITGVSVQTKDAQWVDVSMDVKYRVSKDNAFLVFKDFKTLQKVDELLIQPFAQKAVEQIITQYNVIDLLGEKRNEVYTKIEKSLEDALSNGGVELFALVLTDTDAGPEIENAIKAEAVAKKQIETATQTQEKARIEAETKVIEAEAAARVKLIEAETLAETNRLISNSITENILRKMEMEARLKFGWVEITGAQLVIGQ